MRRYHIDKGIRNEAQIDPRTDLGYPVANPTDQQYRDAGWIPVVEADAIPEGMVSPDGVTGAVEGGVYVERHVRLITQAVFESEQAAAIAEEQSRQAREDVANYQDSLVAIAALAQVVPTIAQGDDMPAIVRKAAQAHEAAVVAGDIALATRIAARSLTADSAWDEVLSPAGVTGDRLWRAFGLMIKG